MLSGIADAEYLQSLGIAVVADLPGVGQNLQDHVLVSVSSMATQHLHTAITSNGAGEAGLFLHSEGNLDAAPDLEMIFGLIVSSPPGYPNSSLEFSGKVILTHPENIGSVSLRSLDPKDTPIIRLNYLQS